MSTRFFERQDAARSNSFWLVCLFTVAVIGLVGVTSSLAYFAVAEYAPPGEIDPAAAAILVGLATVAVIAIGSLYQTLSLAAGGGMRVAESVGGRQIRGDVTNPAERRLMNVVEEMAIASGTPVPPVYLLEESAINAFAAGYSPGDAVIGVTRGAMEKLTRDELQGVIAHEYSHVFNGDMRMNIRMIGVLHGILLLSLVGHVLLRSLYFAGGRRSSDRGSGAIVIALLAAGLILIVIGGIGSFIGGLIKAAVSRQREYLADASAVQFTRNPSGIAGALKRIGGFSRHGRLEHPNAGIASHMYFAQGVFEGLTGLLATHPPLEKRIRAIEPAWDGQYLEPVERPVTQEKAAEQRPAAAGQRFPLPFPLPFPHAGAAAGFAGAAMAEAGSNVEAAPAGASARGATGSDQHRVPLAEVLDSVDHVGEIEADGENFSASLLGMIDANLLDAAHDAYSARALVFAMLIDSDADVRKAQFEALEKSISPDVVELTRRLLPQVNELPDAARLPLVDVALPMLRMMTPPQYSVFSTALQELIRADNRLTIFEWALSQVLIRHLRGHYAPSASPVILFYRLQRLGREVSVLLSTLARVGHGPPQEIEHAFNEGRSKLPDVPLELLPAGECSFTAIEAAIDKLAKASHRRRSEVLVACAACVSADGLVTVKEAELLRGIADLLDCPMPPPQGTVLLDDA